MRQPFLVVFGGLPGTGKTSLARGLSQRLGAVYLRIDTIEQVLERAGAMKTGGEGYDMAYAIAGDNLRMGNIVIGDSVNPIAITRDAWRGVAEQAGVPCLEVEIICSDEQEHQRRVETRVADIAGHKMPTWHDVVTREYEPWTSANLVIDTAGKNKDECLEALVQGCIALLEASLKKAALA